MELKLILSNFENFLEEDWGINQKIKDKNITELINESELLSIKFPYKTVLKASYHQIDFANWLLCSLFGDMEGYCDVASDMKACNEKGKHIHNGNWTSLWLVKTDYDYGFNEWFFKDNKDCDIFISILPLVNKMDGFGIYDDKPFSDFLKNVFDKVSVLSLEEKLHYFFDIDWQKISDECNKETYNFYK